MHEGRPERPRCAPAAVRWRGVPHAVPGGHAWGSHVRLVAPFEPPAGSTLSRMLLLLALTRGTAVARPAAAEAAAAAVREAAELAVPLVGRELQVGCCGSAASSVRPSGPGADTMAAARGGTAPACEPVEDRRLLRAPLAPFAPLLLPALRYCCRW